jgi:hypothetical protein
VSGGGENTSLFMRLNGKPRMTHYSEIHAGVLAKVPSVTERQLAAVSSIIATQHDSELLTEIIFGRKK